MPRARAFWIFLATVAVTVVAIILFIQSRQFAGILKDVARRYLPSDFGIEGEFSDLEVKFLPPGVVVRNPSVIFAEKNVANLPGGTKLDAKHIDVTFQFFQLLTGAVTINAVSIHGATLALDLNPAFFEGRAAPQPAKKKAKLLSWETLVRVNFRSVSLVESKLDLRIRRRAGDPAMRLRTDAREFTVGRTMVDRLSGYDFAMDLDKTDVEVGKFSQGLSQLQARLEVSADGVNVHNFSVREGVLVLNTNGSIKGNVLSPKALRAELAYVLRGPLTEWFKPAYAGRFVKLPKGKELLGTVSIDGELRADLMDFERTVEAKAAVELENVSYGAWKASTGVVRAAWKAPLLSVESGNVELAEGGGAVRIDGGDYDSSEAARVLRVKANFSRADLRKALGPLVSAIYPLHMRLSGPAEAEVSFGSSVKVGGKADLQITDFSLDNQSPRESKPLKVLLAFPSARLRAGFFADADGVRIEPSSELTLPNSRLGVSGRVDGKNGFDLDVRGHIHLPDVGRLAKFDIAGAGELHWTIKGKAPDVFFTFEADLKDAYYLNLHLGACKGRVVWDDNAEILRFHEFRAMPGRSEFLANGSIDLGNTDVIDMTVQAPRANLQDLASVFSEFIKKAVPWYPHELTGQMQGTIKVSGKTDMDQLSVMGDMNVSNVDYRYEIFRHGKLHAGYRRGDFVAENVSVQKKTGWLHGNIVFGADDVLRWDMRSEGMSTLDLDRLGILDIPYRAPLAVMTEGSGKLGRLKGSLRMALGPGFIKNYPVPPSELTFNAEAGRIRGALSALGGAGRIQLDTGWGAGVASTLTADAERLDFLPALVAMNPALTEDPELGSEVTGSMNLNFRTGELSRLSGVVDVRSYSLRRRGYSLVLARPLHVPVSQGNYRFDEVRFTGEGTNVGIQGRVDSGEINYSIQGPVNLSVFEFAVPEIAALRGSATVKAQVYGRAEAPRFRAGVRVEDSDLRLLSIEQPFEGLRYDVLWQDSTLRFSDIRAKFAGGQVAGDGTAEIYYYKVPDLDFSFRLDNPKVKVYPVSYARTSGKLTVKGQQLPYKVRGTLNVAEALIRENFSLSEGSRVLRSSKFLPQKGPGLGGEFQIFELDIDTSASRGIYVKNDLFDAELRGDLKILNTIRAPRLLGNVAVLQGKLLFKDNFFAIQSGNLRFTNPAVLDPEFDMAGQTEVKGYKVSLVATGKVSDYRLSFDSQPPLSQKDIVNLLTLGITSTGFQSLGREDREAYSRDELYGLLFSQSGINKGLQEKLGVKLSVGQTQTVTPGSIFSAKGTTDATGTVAPKVVLQKEVTKNLNASAGTTVGVGENSAKDLNLEYSLGRKWSFTGVYEDQRGAQPRDSRTSVGADLKFKLRFK